MKIRSLQTLPWSLLCLIVSGGLGVEAADLLPPTDLRCEFLVNPQGIDMVRPHLSWRLEWPERGQSQTAYRVLVASQPDLLAQDQGDLWDSGKVNSDQSIHVEYAGQELKSAMYVDGSSQLVVSDDMWKITNQGPIRANSEFDGEEYDARMEQPGWDQEGFDDTKWQPAQLVAAPGGKLIAQMVEPMRVIETLKPVAILSPQPGIHVAAFYNSFLGECRIDQREDGCVSDAGSYWPWAYTGDPCWPAVVTTTPWSCYRMYGDRRILAENYPTTIAGISRGHVATSRAGR